MTDPLDRLTTALQDRYRIERELGAGGMATVYLADDLKHHRKVAIKVLRPELAAALGPDRFLREIEVTANLQHPHILPLHDSGRSDDILYYVMAYVEGESLHDRLVNERQLPLDEVVSITRDIAGALEYAHRNGVIHRDIKPANIMLQDGRALVADFGIALALTAAAGERLTETGFSLGTPEYMSPEQATSERTLDARADVYSLGAVVYEMLTGDPPFQGHTVQAIVTKLVTSTPVRPRTIRKAVPETMDAAVMKALAKTPADRFASANALVEAMTAKRGARWSHPVLAVSAVLVLLLAVVTGVGLAFRDSGDTPSGSAVEPIERLVVVPFANRTGDPEADIWGQLVAGESTRAVDRLRTIDVVPSVDVLDVLQSMEGGQGISARELAERTSATYTVTGSYTRAGETMRFDLELANATTGELISTLVPVEGPADSLGGLVSRVADGVAAAVMAFLTPDEVAATLGRPSPPPSPEAWRQWVSAANAFCRTDYEGAIAHGEQAIAMAPEWVPPYLFVLPAYSNLGRARPDTLIGRVTDLVPRMTAFERANWDWLTAPTQVDRFRAGEEMFRISPRYWYPLAFRALHTNRIDRARVAVDAAIYDNPCFRRWFWQWRISATVYHLTDDHEAELRIALDGRQRFPENLLLIDAVVRAHAAMGRVGEIDALVTSVFDLPRQPQDPLGRRALVAARELRRHGYEEAASTFSARAVAWFEAHGQDNSTDLAAAYHLDSRWEDLLAVANTLLAENPDTLRALAYAGIAYAHLDSLEKFRDVERRLNGLSEWGAPRWRAAVAAAKGDRAAAVRHLQSFFDQEPTVYYNNGGSEWDFWLHDFPEFDALWDYPQFRSLIRFPDVVGAERR